MSADNWHAIEQELDAALEEARELLNRDPRGLFQLVQARYEEGARAYRGEWLSRPIAWFDGEAAQEAADLVCYLAMRRVLERVHENMDRRASRVG